MATPTESTLDSLLRGERSATEAYQQGRKALISSHLLPQTEAHIKTLDRIIEKL